MALDPLRYPLAGDRADEAVVGGWVLYLVAGVVPVLPLVPLVGYFVRVLGASATGADTPPPTGGPVGLVRQGVVASTVVATFLAVPTALLVGTAGGLARAPNPRSPTGSVVVLLGGTAVLLVTVTCLYLLPAALASYGATGYWRRAFHGATLQRTATHGAYFYRWWLGATGFLLGTAAAVWLWQLHPVTRALAPLPAVYLQLVACHVWGSGVAAATGQSLTGDSRTTASATDTAE